MKKPHRFHSTGYTDTKMQIRFVTSNRSLCKILYKDGSTVQYVQNLNMAYFKNLSYRTNVTYQEQKYYMRTVRTYFSFDGTL